MRDIDPEDGNFTDFDEIDVNEEYPTLMQVARFAELVQKTPWFHHLGKPLTDHTLKISRDYLEALGFPESFPAEVPDWQEAISCLETNDWNSPAWEAEEQLAASLISDTLEFIEEDVLEVALTNVTVKAAEFINNAVETASILWGVDDEEQIAAAVGQAVQCCYHAALVIAAGDEETHPFALKYRLYESGHWPLGIAGNTFNIF
ncbi:MAG: hypothetical protein H6912_11080 [Kordiimonadaceae bacterium]|nr:hypothetical protein [Kordiimonadaceae bacterium]